jgi:hypothetical protein
MTPPPPSPRSQPRPKAASPAERSEEFAAHQRQLKAEAAERRQQATRKPTAAGRGRASQRPAG